MKKILGIVVVLLAASAPNLAFAHDIVLREQGKPILGVSYPSDWKQIVEKNYVVATSEDGTAWSVTSAMDDIQDKQAGVTKIKEGFEDYLKEITYDELTETESGSLVLSGKGKGNKTGVDVVFTSAVFESGPGRFAGIVFIIDADIEKYYEKTVLAICQSVLVESDFADEATEADDAAEVSLHSQPWLVEDIAGRGVVDKAQTTIAFSDDGSVSGNTSVNRYQGKVEIDGQSISFGPLAATRRAGSPALMDQESKFFQAIDTVKSYRIEPTGILFLSNEAGDPVLRLSPMDRSVQE